MNQMFPFHDRQPLLINCLDFNENQFFPGPTMNE